jgi:uncharacterized protein
MLKNKVSGFEVPISDMAKANEFYGKIFDWNLVPIGGGFMALTTPVDHKQNPTVPGGINGGFYKRSSKNQQPTLIVETDSIDETLKKIKEAGGKILAEKHEIDKGVYMADFADPEGNEMTLMETDRM